MTKIVSPRAARRSVRPAMTMKWLGVLAAMSVATVLDGISISETGKVVLDAMSSSQQAAITLPSDRCGPGCAIMVASNQSGDAFITRSQ